MNSNMQSNKCIDMQSSDTESNRHHHLESKKSKRSRRAYQSKSKQVQIVHESRNLAIVEKELAEKCLGASTSASIDLPHVNIHVAADNVSYNVFFNKEIEIPPNTVVLSVPSNVNNSSECFAGEYTCDISQSDPLLIEIADTVQANETQNHVKNTVDFVECKDTAIDGTNIGHKKTACSIVSPSNERKSKGQKVSKLKTLRTKKSDVSNRTATLKRPEYQVLGFMEDYAEFGADLVETLKCKGRYVSSVLESTVDGSIVKGARRAYGPRMTATELTSCIESAIEVGESHQDPLKSLDEWGLKSEQHKYKCSACEITSQNRVDIQNHISNAGGTHTKAVVVVLLGNKAQGKTCSFCNVRLNRNEYFKHMRKEHTQSFPLRCGFCVFQGQDYNQIRHHIQKKHGTSEYKIIDISQTQGEELSSGVSSVDAALYEDEHMEKDSSCSKTLNCPLCSRTLKTLQNLRKHVMQHSKQKKQCNLCSFTTNFPTQIRSHYQRKHPSEKPEWKKVTVESNGFDTLVEDATPFLKLISTKYGVRKPKEKSWKRQYRCRHCDYTCNFNSSYNRHLKLHEGVKPFKCEYCDFHGREAYVVRKHCLKFHKGMEVKMVYDKDFKAPYRYSKKIKTETFEWDESTELPEDEMKSDTVGVFTGPEPCDIKVEEFMEYDTSVLQTECNSLSLTCLGDNIQEMSLPNASVPSSNTGNYQDDTVNQASDQTSLEDHLQSSTTKELKNAPKRNKMLNDKTCIDDRSSGWIGSHNSDRQCSKIMFDHTLSNAVTASKNTNDFENENVIVSSDECDSTPLLLLMKKAEIDVAQISADKATNINATQCEGISPAVRVKTFRNSVETTTKYAKENHKNCDETNKISMQLSATNIESESISNYRGSSITINPAVNHSDNLEAETVVIQLYANDFYAPKEIITRNASEESEDKYAIQESLFISKEDSGILMKITEGNVMDTSGDGVIESAKPIQGIFKDPNIVASGCPELLKGADNLDNFQVKSKDRKEQSAKMASNGLENTLHTHITFLSDSLAHRLSSNRIPATPGVMTRDLLDLDYSNNDYFSAEKVRMMMKKKKGGRVKCRECGASTTFRAFYKHAKKHFNIKPFKCGYCTYRSIEKSKIRVHNAFCHSGKPCIILKLSPENASVDESTIPSVKQDDLSSMSNHKGKIEKSTAKTNGTDVLNLSNTLQVSDEKSCNNYTWIQRKKIQHENSSTNKTGVDSVKNLLSFQCPLCNKILKNHTPSIRRHLYSHYGYKPYKCGYCLFTAIGQTEIRAHHVTHGSISSPKVESSGVTIPHGLTQYIDELLSQKLGSKRISKKKEQNAQNLCNFSKNVDTDVMWHDMDSTCKEDLTSVYLNSEEKSQQGLISNQNELENLNIEPCPLPQPSDSSYAVQVLAGGQNSDFSNDAVFDPEMNSQSSVGTDPVCVLYIF